MIGRRLTVDGVLLILVCIVASAAVILTLRRHMAGSQTVSEGAAEAPQFGDEIQIVLIVSRTCRSCQSLVEDAVIGEMVRAVQLKAEDRDLKTRLVGIAVDQSWEGSIDFLRSIADFDEVLAGGGWLNTGVVLFGHRDIPGPISVPQIVVIRRNVSRLDDHTIVAPDQLLLRKVGLNELWAWQARGFPIPLGSPTQ